MRSLVRPSARHTTIVLPHRLLQRTTTISWQIKSGTVYEQFRCFMAFSSSWLAQPRCSVSWASVSLLWTFEQDACNALMNIFYFKSANSWRKSCQRDSVGQASRSASQSPYVIPAFAPNIQSLFPFPLWVHCPAEIIIIIHHRVSPSSCCPKIDGFRVEYVFVVVVASSGGHNGRVNTYKLMSDCSLGPPWITSINKG